MPEELKPTMTQNFIHDFIDEDIAQGGQFQGMTVHTRFPPEPNGYLHIGHAKAIFVDFGTAEKYGGLCNLRMDDTNPTKEDVEYVEAIQEDIHWLGYDWGDRFFFASDYFEKMYEYAVELIKKGLAYVCELTPEQFKEYRGDVNTPARSPFRDRPIEESLDLFARMRAGEFPNGAMTLRAKIDLASGNFNMRDPVLYRINHMHHHRQGDKWCIYPMYDFAHPPEDGAREVTFSRELYIEAEDFLPAPVPKYKRLYPDGPECRLKGAYVIKCTGYETDAAGNVTAILAEYDPDSRGGDPADGRKVKGATIHWVDAATAVDAEVRLYDNLFTDAEPDAGDKNFLDCLNPSSLEVLPHAKVEAGLAGAEAPASFQFLRQGYFCVDNKDSAPGHLVFNRSVSLKDSFKF